MTDVGKHPTTAAEHNAARTFVEELEVSGTELVERVRALMREGNARRVTILGEDGRELFSVSLTLGAVAGGLVTLASPALAALGALAALVSRVKLVVTREQLPGSVGALPPDHDDTIT